MKPDMPRDSENPQQCDSLAELPAWQLGTWGAHTDPLSVAVPEAGVTSVSSVSALGTGPPYAWGGPSCSMGSFAERKGMSHSRVYRVMATDFSMGAHGFHSFSFVHFSRCLYWFPSHSPFFLSDWKEKEGRWPQGPLGGYLTGWHAEQ